MGKLTQNRSDRAEVRNPILALPAAKKLADLSPDTRQALDALIREIRDDARSRAQESWKKNKGPMAAYWKATGAYCNHISRALRRRALEASADPSKQRGNADG